MNFILPSTEAELLIQFEQNPSLERLSKSLGRDPTAISRQLKRISEKGDFLIKSHGRWKITENGKKMNQATSDYLLIQNRILNSDIHIKIGSTREFCSRVLAPNVSDLEKSLGVKSISLFSFEGSVENALLSGQIDIAFDCGKPYSPDIKYKQVLEEPISPVATGKLIKKFGKINTFSDLENHPHILCSRLHPDRVSKKSFNAKQVAGYCNDIAIAKSLCLSSQGWALLPIYAVKEELKSKKLKVISDISFTFERFGVWSLRERKGISMFFNGALKWLRNNESMMGFSE